MTLESRVEWSAGVAVVSVAGEVDLATVDQFSDAIQKAVQDAPGVVIDLSQVTYLDSSGVRALFQAANLAPADCLIAVVPERSVVRRVAELVDLAAAVPICESVDEAIKTLRHSA